MQSNIPMQRTAFEAHPGNGATAGATAGGDLVDPIDEGTHVPTKSVPGTGRHIVIAIIVVVIALALVFGFGVMSRRHTDATLRAAAIEAEEAPPAVEVVQVHRAGAGRLLALPGNARAFNETTLYARTSGYLKEWTHDIGDHVKQGDLLATIETPELDDQLHAAEAKVAQQRSEVDLAQASVTFAKLSYERWQSAVPEGVVSTQDRDQKKAELDTSSAKLEAAKAQLKLADADVQRLQTLVGFKNVVAPFDGTITQREVDIGDLVTAGSTSSTTPLFEIARSDQIRVFVEVPQSGSGEIKIGMPVKVTASDSTSRTFNGKVSRTADSIDPASRTLRVEVLVPNPDYALKPGMYVEATFLTDRATPPLEIPSSALALRPSGPQVAVVGSDGTVHFKNIHIAQDLGDHIEIDRGLTDGETVALNINSDLVDGDKVVTHPFEDETPAAASLGGAPSQQPQQTPQPQPAQQQPQQKAAQPQSAHAAGADAKVAAHAPAAATTPEITR